MIVTLAVCAGCGLKEESPSARNPPVFTVTPSTGEGPRATFLVKFETPERLGNTMGLLINDRLDGLGSCYVLHHRGRQTFSLLNDAGNMAVAASPGKAIENSQCAIDESGPIAEMDGHDLVLRIPLAFKPAFAGPKFIYVYREAGIDKALKPGGTWMVAP